MRTMPRRLLVATIVGGLLLLGIASPVGATTPGRNGRIPFSFGADPFELSPGFGVHAVLFSGLDAGIAQMQRFNSLLAAAGVQIRVNQAGQLHGFGGHRVMGGAVRAG
jgi:hypothetical protein